MKEDPVGSFEEANKGKQATLLSEFFQLLSHNKKFWLLPIVIGLLVLGALVVFGGTVAAPFIYTLF